MLRIKTITLVSLFSIFCAGSFAQGFLKTQGKTIVNNRGENILLRGVGLGGWMLQEGYMLKINKDGQQYRIKERIESLMGIQQTQAFYNAWLNNHVRKIDIDSMKRWGFNSVRLPMHYNLYTLPADEEPEKGENTWLEKGFVLTDSLLSWCKSNQMYLIFDLHAAPGGQGNDVNIADRNPSKPYLWDSEANQQKTIALWKKIAERYKDEPFVAAYDILNEPNYGFQNPKDDPNGTREKLNAPLRKLMVEITEAIRSVDKNHIIIIEGNGWGNNYKGIFPLWDKNIVLSYHKYWNYNSQEAIAGMLKARDEHNVPVWLGETGENSNVWFRDAIHLLEKNNIGWCWWPLKKMGINNPMEIKSNPDYEALVKFLNTETDRPDKNVAYRGLMQLANDARLENTTIHYDVLDAMLRQPADNTTKAFKSNILNGSLTINAVDYDLGRNGFAYFDRDTADYHVSTGKTTAGNKGYAYRNDGVDISKKDGKYVVSHIEKGEWLLYTLNVQRAGNYTIKVDALSLTNMGKLSVLIDNKAVGSNLDIPFKAEQNANVIVKGVKLDKGLTKLKILAEEGGFELSQITLIE